MNTMRFEAIMSQETDSDLACKVDRKISDLEIAYQYHVNLFIPVISNGTIELDRVVVYGKGVVVITIQRCHESLNAVNERADKAVAALESLLTRTTWCGDIFSAVITSKTVVTTESIESICDLKRLNTWICSLVPSQPQRMPGMPNLVLQEVRKAMESPPIVRSFLPNKIRPYPWMESYKPSSIRNYWMKDCKNLEPVPSDHNDNPLPTGLKHIASYLSRSIGNILCGDSDISTGSKDKAITGMENGKY